MSITCSKCGQFLELNRIYKKRYCLACSNEYARNYRKKYFQLNEDQKKKANTRSYTKVLIRRGQIKRSPCQVCGEEAEVHHPDYLDPWKVIWLCRKHHLELHENFSK